MMRIDIISAVPQLLSGPLDHSIVGRAREKGTVEIHTHDLRDYSTDKHHKVDDAPYGGGAGMVLSPQPIFACVDELKSQRDYDEIIFPTPDAPLFQQPQANTLSMAGNLMFLCGHYKGVDQRVRDRLITCEYSVGDFVLSGGELPAMMMANAIVRLLPGVLGDAESALTDSFQNDLMEGPVYTRPAAFEGMDVPEVLRSGDHKKIETWRQKQSLERTHKVRPELLKETQKTNN